MLFRFSLYGFLKNQRYFEPFIILFFLDAGLSFTQIGLLVAFRELFVNIMEIPSGAVADLVGRRRAMILSFTAYIISFAIFGLSGLYWQFFVAMFFFAVGEAFRTGTHKAMIFTWLRAEGRTDEKTGVYGYTRSWSKIGSAVSTVAATVFVFTTGDYAVVFLFAIVPYVVGLGNFLTYPKLDGAPTHEVTVQAVLAAVGEALRAAITLKPLRRLIVESMAFEGVFKAFGDYIQPVLRQIALLLPVLVVWEETQRSAVVVGVVYVVLYLASAYASRRSQNIVDRAGGHERGANLLWRLNGLLCLALVPLLYFELYYAAVFGFVGLFLLQNYWRPILISRFDEYATEQQGATVLSIESQAKSVATMIFAPIFGVLVDAVRAAGWGGEFWPVAAVGAGVVIYVVATGRGK